MFPFVLLHFTPSLAAVRKDWGIALRYTHTVLVDNQVVVPS